MNTLSNPGLFSALCCILISSIRPCRFYHRKHILVRGISSDLIARGKNEASSGGSVIYRRFAGIDNILHRTSQHNVCRMEISLEDDLITVLSFEFRQVTVTHRWDFQRVDHGQVGLFGKDFDEFFFRSAGMDMGGKTGLGSQFNRAFYGREGEFSENRQILKDQCA